MNQFGPQEQAKYGVKPGMLLGYRGHLDGLYRHHNQNNSGGAPTASAVQARCRTSAR
jgi:hypothetical protein